MREKVTKVNQVVAMTQRNVFSLKNHLKICIQHLFQPHLEYAPIVWSPWECYLEDALGNVQHRAARHVCNKSSIISVTNLITL